MGHSGTLARRDQEFMWQAIAQARLGEGRTSPNPVVGVVVVNQDRVVASGYHHCAGQAHAEEEALRQAGAQARGAEVFVNLEPCCHRGRRQACTDALIEARVGRVVAGVVDPNPLVNGAGLRALESAGISVTCGVLERECTALNAPFFKYIRTGRPWVTAKYAMSLDGKTATPSGDSRWISGARSRASVHRLRDKHDAVLVGTRTLTADDPRLTTRGVPGGKDAIRVVLDPRGELRNGARVLNRESAAPTWVISGAAAAPALAERLGDAAEVIPVALDPEGRVPIGLLLETLGEREVMTLLVEGGGETLSSFFEADQIDRVVAFVAPVLVGGTDAPTPLGGKGVSDMASAVRLTEIEIERMDDDILISGRPLRADGER